MKKFIFLMYFICYIPAGLAQICPATIEGVGQVKTDIAGWKIDSFVETYHLAAMGIFEMHMNANGGSDDAELAPKSRNGIQYWEFSNSVGRNELWMKCMYAGTSITLSSRINSDVVECFRKDKIVSKSLKKVEVVAKCVPASKNGLNPY